MKAIIYRTRWEDGEIRELVGYPTGVPGLLVSECPDWPGFTVVHVRSGMLVGCEFDNPEVALAAAQALGPLADWTLPGAEMSFYLRRSRRRSAVVGIVDRFGGATYAGAKPSPGRGIDNGVIA